MPPEAINPHQRIFSLKSGAYQSLAPGTSQFLGHSPGAQIVRLSADSWSFGVVVWEILMDGAEPFGNDDAVTAGLRILKGDRLQVRTLLSLALHC